jgi:hypothetical protein
MAFIRENISSCTQFFMGFYVWPGTGLIGSGTATFSLYIEPRALQRYILANTRASVKSEEKTEVKPVVKKQRRIGRIIGPKGPDKEPVPVLKITDKNDLLIMAVENHVRLWNEKRASAFE